MKRVIEELKFDDRGKEDFIFDLSKVSMKQDGRIKTPQGFFDPSDHALTQFFSRIKMPARYSKKLLTARGDLVEKQANFWLNNSDKKALFRTKHDRVRGVLSEKYSRMNNSTIIGFAKKALDDIDADVEEFHLEDRKMRLRVTTPQEKEIEKGDPVKLGLDIENSEVGYCSLKITPIVYRLVCSNGLRLWVQGNQYTQRHIHINEKDFRKQVAIAVHAAAKGNEEVIDLLKKSRDKTMKNFEEELREELSNKTVDRILEHAEDDSVYGIVNGITRTARDIENDDRRVQLEEFAGNLLKKEVA